MSRELLGWDVPFVATGVVAGEIFIALAGPENAEGVVSISMGKMVSETDDPGVQWHAELMEEFASGVPASSFTMYGQTVAELTVEALENAGPDLTRESVVEGAEAIRDFCCTLCRTPVNLSPTDHRPFQTEIYIRVEDGKWVPFGEPVSFESTPGEVIACEGLGEPVYADGGGS